MRKTRFLYFKSRTIFYLSLLFFIPISSLANIQVIAPSIRAQSWILLDYDSGEILSASNPDGKLKPASLTKMMTSYIIGQSLKTKKIKLDDIVTIDKDAWSLSNPELQGSSLMFIKPNDHITVAELNKGIVIQSGNDACIALADFISGNQSLFIMSMNNYAKILGLKNTNFINVHGLDAINQYSSAKDMALIGQALIRDVPTEYAIHKDKKFVFNNITQYNRNKLLWQSNLNIDGIKTGHTSKAGYNLVISAKKNNIRLIAVILGADTSDTRFEDGETLLNWGFKNFENITLIKAQESCSLQDVFFGKKKTIKIGLKKDAKFLIPQGHQKYVEEQFSFFSSKLKAPIKKNQIVGILSFSVNKHVVQEIPLIALDKVSYSNFLKGLWEFLVILVRKCHDYFKIKKM